MNKKEQIESIMQNAAMKFCMYIYNASIPLELDDGDAMTFMEEFKDTPIEHIGKTLHEYCNSIIDNNEIEFDND